MNDTSDIGLPRHIERLSSMLARLKKHRDVGLPSEGRKLLRRDIGNLLRELGVPLPLDGLVLSRVLTTRPGIIRRKTGISSAIDGLITLTLTMSELAAKERLDRGVLELMSDKDTMERAIAHQQSLCGYVCESLGRLWLRDVIGGPWRNYRIGLFTADKVVRELDAISSEERNQSVAYYAAEIKRKLQEKHISEIVKALKAFKTMWTIPSREDLKSYRLIETCLLSFCNDRFMSQDDADRRIGRKLDTEVRIYYLEDIKEECTKRKQAVVPVSILNSIRLLEESELL